MQFCASCLSSEERTASVCLVVISGPRAVESQIWAFGLFTCASAAMDNSAVSFNLRDTFFVNEEYFFFLEQF